MGVCYKKLWKRMIDLELDAPAVQSRTKIAPSTFSKMRKNEYVSMDVLVRLCESLDCQISDIVEVERRHKDPPMMEEPQKVKIIYRSNLRIWL